MWFLMVLSATFLLAEGTQCRPREILDDKLNICYSFQPIPANWTNARHICEMIGYDLVSIQNGFQNNMLGVFAQSHLDMTYGDFWTGLEDPHQSGDWSWSDGSESTYRNWDTAEPAANRYCVAYGLSRSRWHSADCAIFKQFVCAGLPDWGPTTTSCPVCHCSN